MPNRTLHRFTARKVDTIREPGRYADGGGLYLQVGPTGKKSWAFRYQLNGKARQMGIGALHTVSLAEARDEALKNRKLLNKGIDPIDARKDERSQNAAKAVSAITFEECAEAYISSHRAAWRNPKHAAQWSSTLETYAFPVFGDLPVQAVDTGLVMRVLDPIWRTKIETASRLRGRIEAVLDWATARKHREGENPARWKGHLDKLLPAKSKVMTVKHHAALPYDEVGKFVDPARAF